MALHDVIHKCIIYVDYQLSNTQSQHANNISQLITLVKLLCQDMLWHGDVLRGFSFLGLDCLLDSLLGRSPTKA